MAASVLRCPRLPDPTHGRNHRSQSTLCLPFAQPHPSGERSVRGWHAASGRPRDAAIPTSRSTWPFQQPLLQPQEHLWSSVQHTRDPHCAKLAVCNPAPAQSLVAPSPHTLQNIHALTSTLAHRSSNVSAAPAHRSPKLGCGCRPFPLFLHTQPRTHSARGIPGSKAGRIVFRTPRS